jgi:hypothetical protein
LLLHDGLLPSGLFLYPEDGGVIFLRNIGWLWTDYTALFLFITTAVRTSHPTDVFWLVSQTSSWWQRSKNCGKRVLHYEDCSDLFLKPQLMIFSQVSDQLKCIRLFQWQIFNARLRHVVILCEQTSGQRIPEARGANPRTNKKQTPWL